MRVAHPASASPRTYDGSGTRSKVMQTGHGAPSTPAAGRILPNGVRTLTKLQTTGGMPAPGLDRFVSPTNSATANVPPPGLGNTRT